MSQTNSNDNLLIKEQYHYDFIVNIIETYSVILTHYCIVNK